VQQLADGAAERPAGRRQLAGHVLVRGERRDEQHEAEVGGGEVQQQNVGDGAHAHARHHDDDNERVSGEAEQRNGSE